ncbi:MAG: MmcQ/YjbR family DNA-binding protein [Eubacteriales bacterium]|nr:MmcQ/YjbR family DNA-binding protein [Eubacteriales bacterium]
MNRQELFKQVKQMYGTEPDYPWHDRNAVLRHPDTGKWFAVIMEIPEFKLGLPGNWVVDVVNVKCDPMLIGSLRQQAGYFPAYHMNKDQWISVLLDGPVPEAAILNLISMSYELTQEKKHQESNRQVSESAGNKMSNEEIRRRLSGRAAEYLMFLDDCTTERGQALQQSWIGGPI